MKLCYFCNFVVKMKFFKVLILILDNFITQCSPSSTSDVCPSPVPSNPTDCYDLYTSGFTEDGVYTILPTDLTGSPFEVYCNMSHEGGWTVRLHPVVCIIYLCTPDRKVSRRRLDVESTSSRLYPVSMHTKQATWERGKWREETIPTRNKL